MLGVIPTIIGLVVLGVLVLGVSGMVRKATQKTDRRFADVAHQASVLRQRITQGQMTEAECKAQMQDLMIPGTDGRWWMVGYKTGAWYAHDGANWVRAEPPGFGKASAPSSGR